MGKRERAKKLGQEFREFLIKGNAITLATGVVIGGAFQSIVNSLVNDILMPVLSIATRGIDFSQRFIDLTRMKNPGLEALGTAQAARELGRAVITYGTLLTAILNFLVIGFAVFLLLKSINSVDGVTRRLRRQGVQAPPPTTKQCPYCIMEIAIGATRCPHCTSQVAEDSKQAFEEGA